MRNILKTAALCSVAFLASRALAQADEEVQEGQSLPEGAATIAPAKAPEPNSSAPGAQHTVERGDTLWDLSQRFLGSPWYWPKVWSYNPEIANPHWIYPGNMVRFFPTGDEVPTQVEVGAPSAPEEMEGPELDEGQLIADDDRLQVSGNIGYRPRASVSLASPGFITPREVEELGRIVGAFGEMEQLSFPYTIYGKFDKAGAAKLGETHLIFRNMGEVLHPVTFAPVGYFTRLVGQAQIVGIDRNGMVSMSIVRQQDAVLRGDLIGPAGETTMRQISARSADREVKDVIVVGTPIVNLTSMGENQLLVMDKGSNHGVKAGNVFSIWRQNDPLPQDLILNPSRIDEQYPKEDIAHCIAFEVKSEVTLCLVSSSRLEVVKGDHAEIRVGSGRSASR